MAEYKIKYPEYLDRLSSLFSATGHDLYIVGGFVRDAVMGCTSSDIDICSAARPEEVMHLIAKEEGFKVAESVLPLGTVIIRYGDDILEYTSFRRESYRNDGSHAPQKVSLGATIEEDALRRDFTCNALYYDIERAQTIDFFGGIGDIKDKILNTTRRAEDVFAEDALRILRLARISAETMFEPADDALAAARDLSGTLCMLSKERISAEMRKLLISDRRYPENRAENIMQGMRVLFGCGAAEVLFPGTRLDKSLICSMAESYAVKAALFMYKCTQTAISLDYICPSGEIKKDTEFLLKHSKYEDEEALDILTENGFEKGKLLEEMMRVLKKQHAHLSKYLTNMEQPDGILSMKTLGITGKDIKEALDIPDSPKIGRIKKALLRHVIEHPEDNENGKLIGYLKNI